MRSADLALYRSKDQGGGVYHHYQPKLHVQAEERRVMEIALRKALENDELLLNYQPVVSADTGSVVAFEALLRWNSPKFGNVSPVKFIPIAEDARLIIPIGEWVLRTACEEAMNWPSTVKVAVNVSADQLTEPDFLETVVSALQDSGLPPHRLEIEVTESIFMRQGAAKNVPESLAIIRAVVAMADSLGMATTAEGAETQEEVQMIQKLGCTKIQGYYFGRPMVTEDARKLFSTFDAETLEYSRKSA